MWNPLFSLASQRHCNTWQQTVHSVFSHISCYWSVHLFVHIPVAVKQQWANVKERDAEGNDVIAKGQQGHFRSCLPHRHEAQFHIQKKQNTRSTRLCLGQMPDVRWSSRRADITNEINVSMSGQKRGSNWTKLWHRLHGVITRRQLSWVKQTEDSSVLSSEEQTDHSTTWVRHLFSPWYGDSFESGENSTCRILLERERLWVGDLLMLQVTSSWTLHA